MLCTYLNSPSLLAQFMTDFDILKMGDERIEESGVRRRDAAARKALGVHVVHNKVHKLARVLVQFAYAVIPNESHLNDLN